MLVFHLWGCNSHSTDSAEEDETEKSYEVDSTEIYEPGNHERYLSIGFDDFRASDFTMVIPIFNEYGAHATFNRIAYVTDFSEDENWKMNVIIETGNELGDHTWYH